MQGTAVDFSTLGSVKEGDELVVRFKRTAREDLIYVEAMERSGVIIAKTEDLMRIDGIRVVDEYDWPTDDDRTFTFTVGPDWSQSFFEGRMRRAIESLEVRRK